MMTCYWGERTDRLFCRLAKEVKLERGYFENVSLLFYYEMKDIIPQPAQPTVNKIIAVEKSHLRQLSELKKKLARA